MLSLCASARSRHASCVPCLIRQPSTTNHNSRCVHSTETCTYSKRRPRTPSSQVAAQRLRRAMTSSLLEQYAKPSLKRFAHSPVALRLSSRPSAFLNFSYCSSASRKKPHPRSFPEALLCPWDISSCTHAAVLFSPSRECPAAAGREPLFSLLSRVSYIYMSTNFSWWESMNSYLQVITPSRVTGSCQPAVSFRMILSLLPHAKGLLCFQMRYCCVPLAGAGAGGAPLRRLVSWACRRISSSATSSAPPGSCLWPPTGRYTALYTRWHFFLF